VDVTTTATIPFDLATSANASDMETASKLFPLSTKRHQAVSQRADPDEEVSACQEAAAQADRFSTDTRFIERRSAYVYYATALIRAKKPKEAVAVGQKAIAVVLQDTTTDKGNRPVKRDLSDSPFRRRCVECNGASKWAQNWAQHEDIGFVVFGEAIATYRR
jgi:hypothetical protein